MLHVIEPPTGHHSHQNYCLGKMTDCSNGMVAIDSYHRFKEDVSIMKKMGLDAYRFSISWSRLLPCGKLCGGVNKEGINFYNTFIDELIANGIEPFVTLFHWDLPQALEDEYGGFLSHRIIADYVDFADLCFWEFGDRVKHWATCNEPWTYTVCGYVRGSFAPGRGTTHSTVSLRSLTALGRGSLLDTHICTDGDPGTEPYIVAHNLLLCHAAAVEAYRSKYQTSQKGKIGIVLNSSCWDGINYYTSNYAKDAPHAGDDGKLNYTTDSKVELLTERNKVPIGPPAGSTWLLICPEGIYKLLDCIRKKYNNPLVYITENGVDEKNDNTLTLAEARHDEIRRDYHDKHLRFVRYAIHEGANVKGYFVWSFMDNFEWSEGYTVRFGMIYIDYKNDLTRYPKDSAIWFRNFLTKSKKRPVVYNELDNLPNKK
ncbi:hypothetical protein F0562_013128 [Nyssa sinensis]|uniref:Beta-glucosidase n=1 Tax=Nyssa sinensis TaxID=561372 RepID=A0A5J4ZZI8_9ASTE|nr:hypothetical protein F0562_013128 [Nyssa sinensis]